MDPKRKRNSIVIGDNDKSPTRRLMQKRFSMTEQMLPNEQLPLEFQWKASLNEVRPSSQMMSKDEFIEAMVEDLCDWFNFLYKLENGNQMIPSQFFLQIEDGIILNKHAGVVQYLAENYLITENISNRTLPMKIGNQKLRVPKQSPTFVVVDFTKKMNAFHKRDNVANFIHWCRDFNIPHCLTFETEDLIMNKNLRNVVVCLLEVARIGRLFEMEVPDIIQMEEEIDKEIVNDATTPVTPDCSKHSAGWFSGHESDPKETDIDGEGDRFCNVTLRKNRAGFSVEDKNKLSKQENDNNSDHVDNDEQFRNVTLRKKCIPRLLPDRRFSQESSNIADLKIKSQSVNDCNYDLSPKDLEPPFLNYDNCPSGKYVPHSLKVDNSDNESINSHGSQYTIPKYKAFKPVGRVKIYDCFDKTNFIREKKYREKCDMKSLDEMVREILSECTCSETFPMKRISEGRYQWGDKKAHIFVRILRNYVMVRVGGGWDTLNNFLRKHDHCRKDKNGCHKPIISPPIKGPLKLSVTCPADLKIIGQESPMTKESQVNSIPNQNDECDHVKHDTRPIIKTRVSTESQLPRKLLTISRSFENEGKITISDIKRYSEEIMTRGRKHSAKNETVKRTQNENLSKPTETTKTFQSDQRPEKYLSRIPVLLRR